MKNDDGNRTVYFIGNRKILLPQAKINLAYVCHPVYVFCFVCSKRLLFICFSNILILIFKDYCFLFQNVTTELILICTSSKTYIFNLVFATHLKLLEENVLISHYFNRIRFHYCLCIRKVVYHRDKSTMMTVIEEYVKYCRNPSNNCTPYPDCLATVRQCGII